MEEEIHKIAKNYMEVLYAAFEYFEDECETREDMDEVNDLVVSAYTDGIEKAINELEWGTRFTWSLLFLFRVMNIIYYRKGG